MGPQGTEDLGGGLKAIFKIENGFNIGTGGIGGQVPIGSTRSLFNRQAYVSPLPISTVPCVWDASSMP